MIPTVRSVCDPSPSNEVTHLLQHMSIDSDIAHKLNTTVTGTRDFTELTDSQLKTELINHTAIRFLNTFEGDGGELEKFSYNLIKRLGHTPRQNNQLNSSDGGIDFLFVHRGTNELYAVECKSQRSRLDQPSCRATNGNQKHIDNHIVISPHGFTKNAVNFYHRNNEHIEYWTAKTLAKKFLSLSEEAQQNFAEKCLTHSQNTLEDPPEPEEIHKLRSLPKNHDYPGVKLDKINSELADELKSVIDDLQTIVDHHNDIPTGDPIEVEDTVLSKNILRYLFGSIPFALLQAQYDPEPSDNTNYEIDGREILVAELSILHQTLDKELTRENIKPTIETYCRTDYEVYTNEFHTKRDMLYAAGVTSHLNDDWSPADLLAENRRLCWALERRPTTNELTAFTNVSYGTYTSHYSSKEILDYLSLAKPPGQITPKTTRELREKASQLEDLEQVAQNEVITMEVYGGIYKNNPEYYSAGTHKKTFGSWLTALGWGGIKPDSSQFSGVPEDNPLRNY